MLYRQGFVLIEEENGWANVTNDGWHVCGFIVNSDNQSDFEEECRIFLESERFHNALKEQRGY